MSGPITNSAKCECTCGATSLRETSIWELEEEISWVGIERGYVEWNKDHGSCNMGESNAKDEKLE